MEFFQIISVHDAMIFLSSEGLSDNQYAFCMDYIKRHTLEITNNEEKFIDQHKLVTLKFLLALSYSRGIPIDRVVEEAYQREFPFTRDDITLKKNIFLHVSKHFSTEAIYAYNKLI